jgi:hypothetical protein
VAGVFQYAGGSPLLVSLSYEAAVGVSPQEAHVVLAPQPGDALPPAYGDVTFGDDTGVITLRGCAVRLLTDETTAAGRDWVLSVLDRRWRWREGYPATGDYNQTDDRRKLIPRTVRSPHQLAVILLTLMGEPEPAGGWAAVVHLPGGLAATADSAAEPPVPPPGPADTAVDPAADYLALGQNLPQSGTNPETAWLATPAASALAELAERYGRVVVYDPVTDAVSVQRVGFGAGLPAGGVPVASGGATLSVSQVPARVTVHGAPTRFQMRLLLRPVGRDWDDSWQVPDELTYAPGEAGDADRWSRCDPPDLALTRPTPRLSYFQALALAQGSVYRCYQVVTASPERAAGGGSARPGVIPVPSFADPEFPRDRFRVLLQASRPEQVAPRPGDEQRLDKDTAQPFAAEVYNGYSKDRKPLTFAGVSAGSTPGVYGYWGDATGLDADGNTPFAAPLHVPFEVIDPLRQVVRFAAPLYRLVGAGDARRVRFPDHLVVETGCLVLDHPQAVPHRMTYGLELGGPAPAVAVVRDDCQVEVIGQYDAGHRLTGWALVDADGFQRADHYARAHALRYQASEAAVVRYVGLLPVSLSGRVRQVGWFMSAAGFDTTAAANAEYSPAVPPYPARRRAESLPPDPVTAARNLSGVNGALAPPPNNAARRQGA